MAPLSCLADGGAAIRFVIGEYGSGKTFFLNLVRLIALEKGMVVMAADLAPDRRLQATGGQARSLFAELCRNYADQGSSTKRCLTPAQAGLLLSLHAHQIVAAIHLGLLEANKTADGRKAWLLSLREVEEFGHTYTTPSLLAATHQCNPQFHTRRPLRQRYRPDQFHTGIIRRILLLSKEGARSARSRSTS